jgi:hypothetical protein
MDLEACCDQFLTPVENPPQDTVRELEGEKRYGSQDVSSRYLDTAAEQYAVTVAENQSYTFTASGYDMDPVGGEYGSYAVR